MNYPLRIKGGKKKKRRKGKKSHSAKETENLSPADLYLKNSSNGKQNRKRIEILGRKNNGIDFKIWANILRL